MLSYSVKEKSALQKWGGDTQLRFKKRRLMWKPFPTWLAVWLWSTQQDINTAIVSNLCRDLLHRWANRLCNNNNHSPVSQTAYHFCSCEYKGTRALEHSILSPWPPSSENSSLPQRGEESVNSTTSPDSNSLRCWYCDLFFKYFFLFLG